VSWNRYEKKRDVFYAKVDDFQEMKSAFGAFTGMRREDNASGTDARRRIAVEHRSLYEQLVPRWD
jgi:hypothetical protein